MRGDAVTDLRLGSEIDLLLAEYEPFLRKRFEAEDVSQRPLPPVEVEINGMIERRSVREIHNKFLAPLLPPSHMTQQPYPAGPGPIGRNVSHPPFAGSLPFQHPFQQSNNRRHSTDGFHRPQFPQPNFNNRPAMGRGGGGGGRGEGREFHPPAQHGTKRSYDDLAEDDDRRRDSSGAAHLDNSTAPVTPVQPHQPPVQPASAPARQYVEPKSGDNNDRKMFSYFDVDAPKVPFFVSCCIYVLISMCKYVLLYVCTTVCMYVRRMKYRMLVLSIHSLVKVSLRTEVYHIIYR